MRARSRGDWAGVGKAGMGWVVLQAWLVDCIPEPATLPVVPAPASRLIIGLPACPRPAPCRPQELRHHLRQPAVAVPGGLAHQGQGGWIVWVGGRARWVGWAGVCLRAPVALASRAALQPSGVPGASLLLTKNTVPCHPLAALPSSLQGLVCNYVIARNPPNLPTSERAIPVAIFR